MRNEKAGVGLRLRGGCYGLRVTSRGIKRSERLVVNNSEPETRNS